MFDFPIVGAGVCGLAHALVATRRGKTVVVIDRDPRAKGRGSHSVRTAAAVALYILELIAKERQVRAIRRKSSGWARIGAWRRRPHRHRNNGRRACRPWTFSAPPARQGR